MQNNNEKNVFWIVEDTEALATILSTRLVLSLPNFYVIKSVNSCLNVQAKKGDIILCDHYGVDLEFLNPNGAAVITMSGDPDLNVDLLKPFSAKDLKKFVDKYVEENYKNLKMSA